MFLNEATKLRAQTIIKGLEKKKYAWCFLCNQGRRPKTGS